MGERKVCKSFGAPGPESHSNGKSFKVWNKRLKKECVSKWKVTTVETCSPHEAGSLFLVCLTSACNSHWHVKRTKRNFGAGERVQWVKRLLRT